MNKKGEGLSNQAIGIFPLLLFMFLDNYFSYVLSFIIGIAFCFVCIFVFHSLFKEKIYIFLLLPTAGTFILYSIFWALNLHPILYTYSPLIAEVLLVVVLSVVGFFKTTVLARVRKSNLPNYKRTTLRTTLNEAFFVAQAIQNLYTLHLFIILLYNHIPDITKNQDVEYFLYREAGLLIGIIMLVYGQIRVSLVEGRLKKEMWLPILNEKGQVVGSIARSVSRSSPKKYYHPVIRIIIMYKNMLYLVPRNKAEYISPNLIDNPFFGYVIFRHTMESSVKEILGSLGFDKSISPHFLIRYTFENEKVKHLVSLYVIHIKNEEQLSLCKEGKLWTEKQIKNNMKDQIFSEYFVKEFPYLQTTIFLSENQSKLSIKKQ